MRKKAAFDYYSLKEILKRKAHYNVIFGERSNGKTYAVLLHALGIYAKTGKQLAIIRRYREDFRGKRGQELFHGIVTNGEVERITKGEYSGVYHYGGMWYLSRPDGKGGIVKDDKPFAIGFAISEMEHDKGSSYSDVTTVLFDEFMTRNVYLPNEFVMFQNVLSTIIRLRDDVTIFMCGNTVNRYCPYFNEMGLRHISKMKQGDIDLYTYGEHSPLKVAVEYADSPSTKKPSDVYFAFDNAKLNMIVNGAWEIGTYPHAPCKWTPKDIIFTYFVRYDAILLQCEIIQKGDNVFTFVHVKTTPLRNPENDVIFSLDDDECIFHYHKITANSPEFIPKLFRFFKMDKVFYQDNEVGEVMRNYLLYCGYGGVAD